MVSDSNGNPMYSQPHSYISNSTTTWKASFKYEPYRGTWITTPIEKKEKPKLVDSFNKLFDKEDSNGP